MTAGRVWAHVGQAFAPEPYDVVVIGAGRLGLVCAFHLRRLAPHWRVLIVERDGIPSETGATIAARGVWHGADLPPVWQARARWTRTLWADPGTATGTNRPHDPPFRATGWARALGPDDPVPAGVDLLEPDVFLDGLSPAAREAAQRLVDFGSVRKVAFDPEGGHGSATTLALAHGYGAVALGAHLMLNAEAEPHGDHVRVRRLDITNRMEVVVAQTLTVPARHVVVAAGNEGPRLVEEHLGVVRPHGRAFVQCPHLALPAPPDLPVLARGAFTVRPGAGGLRVLPPLGPADPHGYAPRGGTLNGVPTGTRREVLEALLDALDDWPAFGAEGLNLGRATGDVESAWEARPRGGWPLWEQVTDSTTLLLGGPESDRVGPSVALDLAATLIGLDERPWNG